MKSELIRDIKFCNKEIKGFLKMILIVYEGKTKRHTDFSMILMEYIF